MKGKLHKIEQEWYVKYLEHGFIHTYLPLHPDDVKQIEEDSKVFDNIEARIAAYPEVEFEVVNDNFRYYAKLIQSKEQQKQLITEIMNEDAKDGLYEDDVEIPMKNKTIDYSYGFKDGYKKAKETLYTEEQVLLAIELSDYGFNTDYIIQKIKNSKPPTAG